MQLEFVWKAWKAFLILNGGSELTIHTLFSHQWSAP